MKTTGRAGIASRISSFAVALNIVLNALLIFGLFGAPKLGIVGAAAATVAARATELVWSILAAGRATELTLPGGEKKTVIVRVRWSKMFAPEPELYRDYWRCTGPLLLASLVWGVAYTLYSVIMGHLGGDAVFCAGGDSAFDMYGNIGAMWCFSVPLGFLAAFVLKAHPVVVYCIMNLDEIVKIPAVYLRYKKYIWLRDLTRTQEN